MRGYGRWMIIALVLVSVTAMWRAETALAADAKVIRELSRSMWDEEATDEQLKEKPRYKYRGWVDLSPLQVYRVRYKEDVSISDTDSDWEGTMFRGDVGVGILYEVDERNYVGPALDFGLYYTDKRTETWEETGETVQTNSMRFDGWELKLGVAWEHTLQPQALSITQSLSYVIREIGFRRKISALDPVTGLPIGKVHEDYHLRYLEYSPCFNLIRDQLTVSLKPAFGWMLENEARNDYVGTTITGDGGYIWRMEVRLGYKFLENVEGYLGGLYEYQFLEGDTESELIYIDEEPFYQTTEWPDNELTTWGGMLGVNVLF